MKRARLIGLALLTVAASSCVLTTEPLGSVSEEIDVVDWEGMWIHEPAFSDEPVVGILRVLSRDDASLEISWLEIDDDEVVLRKSTGYLRVFNETLIGYVQRESEKDDAKPAYYWARLEKDANAVRVWFPDYGKIRSMVSTGVLPGQVDGGEYEITLGELNPEQRRFFRPESIAEILRWDRPVLFRRIGG